MLTTKPVPQKTKARQIFCDWFRGHKYSINQILTAEEYQKYPHESYYRFCEKCGHKDFWSWEKYWYTTSHTLCEAHTCKKCPYQLVCK